MKSMKELYEKTLDLLVNASEVKEKSYEFFDKAIFHNGTKEEVAELQEYLLEKIDSMAQDLEYVKKFVQDVDVYNVEEIMRRTAEIIVEEPPIKIDDIEED